MLTSRESAALDRYITGNYGEDQLKGSGRDWFTRAQRKALGRLTQEWLTPKQLRATVKTLDKLVRMGEAQSKTHAGVIQFRLSGIPDEE